MESLVRFSLTPCPPDWTDSHTTIRASNLIPTDPTTLFHMLVSPDEWPNWFPLIRWGRPTSDEPKLGGSRLVSLGVIQLHEVFTHYEPGVRWTFTVDWMTLPACRRFMEDYRFIDCGEQGTRLEWTIRYEPNTIGRVLNPLVKMQLQRDFDRGLVRLADYVATR